MFALTLARRRIAQIAPRYAVTAGLPRFYVAQPPPGLDEGEQNIYSKLSNKFSPTELAVQDVSGTVQLPFQTVLACTYQDLSSLGGCGTFYAISITSNAFEGLPTVKQHRLVNETLKKEIEGIHGLQVCIPLYGQPFRFSPARCTA